MKVALDVKDKSYYQEQLKDVKVFDAILKKNPQIISKLKAQGIDLEAEKNQERERLKLAHPGISNDEIDVRSSIAVYLRHQDAIYAAAPDDVVRQELNSSFEHLRAHAREASIPYQESLRHAADILPSDKAAMILATGATLDTRMIRIGNTLYADTPADRIQQLWTLRPGERPEKFVALAEGFRIKVATTPELDHALA